jgi:hypothetical protein
LCLGWILHEDNAISAATIHGLIQSDISDLAGNHSTRVMVFFILILVNCADWLSAEGRHWEAARVCFKLYDTINGLGAAEKCAYCRRTFASAVKITDAKVPEFPKALSLAFDCTAVLMRYSDRGEDESDQCAEWILALIEDTHRISLFEDTMRSKAHFHAGMIDLGWMNSKFAVAPPLDQLRRGASAMIKSRVAQSIMAAKFNGYDSWRMLAGSLDGFHVMSIFFVSTAENVASSDQLLGVGGHKILSWHSSYFFELYFARCVARGGFCYFTTAACPYTMLPRFADVAATQPMMREWEAADVLSVAADPHFGTFDMASTFALPLLESKALQHACSLRSVSFRNATAILRSLPENIWAWNRKHDGGELAYCSRLFYETNLQALISANLPHTVQNSEVEEWFPSPGMTFDLCGEKSIIYPLAASRLQCVG